MNSAVQNFGQEIRLQESSSERVPSLLSAPRTIDAWRHERMFRAARPLIDMFPRDRWQTVGDGGADAWMLREMGAAHVSASNISDARLRRLKKAGHLDGIEIRALNAEALDLPDHSVDFIFCKEAFHHFPHAPLAFYEFLRVARRGVLLIEPCEASSPRIFDVLRMLAKLVLRRRSPIYEQFEPVGNFIYRVSKREIERALTAIQSPWFAVLDFNDFGTRWITTRPRDHAVARFLFQLGLHVQNGLSAARLMSPGLCAVFIPVQQAPDALKPALRRHGFRIIKLPRNPYSMNDFQKSFVP
jgi:ubiquinone/menaquinone biosynthesis C-methylase UbiE